MSTPSATLASCTAQRELCDGILNAYMETTSGRYASGTVRSKCTAVRRFLTWCRTEHVDPLVATPEDADRFVGMLDRSMSKLTIREYRCNVRVFLRWLQLQMAIHLIETGGTRTRAPCLSRVSPQAVQARSWDGLCQVSFCMFSSVWPATRS